MTDRGFLNMEKDDVVFGDICDSCGQRQEFGHLGSKGLKKHEDIDGDWLLCSNCHPEFEEDNQ